MTGIVLLPAVSYLANGKSADMTSSIDKISTQMMIFSQLIARPLIELDNGKTALHFYEALHMAKKT